MANKIVQAIYDLKDNVSAGLKRIGSAWKGAENDADKASTGINKSTGRMSEGFAAASAGIGKFRAALGGLVALVGLSKLKDALVGILNTGERFGDLRKQFDTAFGGIEAGGEALEKIKTIAADVPNGFEDVAAAAIKLRQAGLDPLDGSLQALLDNANALDQGQQDLIKTIELLGKANLRGEAGLRALVGLSQQGIPAFELLGQALGKSTDEVRAMAEAGQLGSDAIRLLVAEVGKVRAGAAASEMGDLAAQIQKAKDSANAFLAEIADAGALEFFQQRMAALVARVKELSATGELQAFAKRVSDGIVSIGRAAESGITFVVQYSSALVALGKGFLAFKFASFLAGMAASAAAMFQAGTAASAAAGKMGGLRGAMAAIPASVKIGIATVGLDLAIDQWVKFARAVEEAGQIEVEAANLAAKTAEQRRKTNERLDEILRTYEAYSAVVLKTEAEVSSATEVELSEYAKRLEAARKYYAALAFERQRANDPEGTERARQQLQQVGEAIDQVTERMRVLGEAKEKAFAGPAENGLQAALLALGVDAETAGVKITEAGGKAITALKMIALEASATGAQFTAAFSKGLGIAKTTEEVQRMREALATAYTTGKLTFGEWSVLNAQAAAKIAEVTDASKTAAGAVAGIGEAGKAASKTLLIELERARDTAVSVAQDLAEQLARAMRDPGADKTFVDALAERARAADRELATLNKRVADMKGQIADAAGTSTQNLDAMGEAGQRAGGEIAQGAEQASAALRNTANEAGDVADAAADMANQNEATAATLVVVTGAATDLSAALGDVSEAFRQAAEAQTGRRASGGGKESSIFAELRQQREELAEQLRLLKDQNAEYDELERRVRNLRGQYEFLGDDSLRALAQEQQRLEENQRRAQEERQRAQESAAAGKSSGSAAGQPARTVGGVNINFNPTVFGELPKGVAQGWARQLQRELDNVARRRA